MYRSKIELENDGRIQRVHLLNNETWLSCSEVLKLWQTDAIFRTFFISILYSAPYSAYRWETPALAETTLDHSFEFVLLDSPYLNPLANPVAFQEFLQKSQDENVAVFPNLGKDAILIAPTLKGKQDTYAHLASFTRQAADYQKHAFWRKVGEMMEQNVNEKPIWLNTAGAGVAWLHVRLDSSPKYYAYNAFRNFP
jgi:hypothetical protein